MGNDLVTQAEGRAVAPQRTPQGAQALRLIASSAPWRIEDAAFVEQALTPALRAALPMAQREADAMNAPATRGDFKRLVAPSLALCAPAGMSEQDQTAWLAVAAETLRGMPADLLAMGCKAARETADHPSKIVPTILKAVKRYWDGRKADAARLETLASIARGERRRLPWEADAFDPSERCAPDEAAKILAEAGISIAADAPERSTPRGPARMPTAADYAAAGVTAEMLEASRRAAAAEEAAKRATPPAAAPDVKTGPAIKSGDPCPYCGNEGVDEHQGVMLCTSLDCMAEWRPDPDFEALAA